MRMLWGMDRLPTTDSSVLPGTAVLILCVAILLAGYVSAAVRPAGATAVAVGSVPTEH